MQAGRSAKSYPDYWNENPCLLSIPRDKFPETPLRQVNNLTETQAHNIETTLTETTMTAETSLEENQQTQHTAETTKLSKTTQTPLNN